MRLNQPDAEITPLAFTSGGAVRALNIGAGQQWYSPDSAFELSFSGHEMLFTVTDQSIAHHAYAPAPLPAIVTPTSGLLASWAGVTLLTAVSLDLEGASWSTLPSSATKILVHGKNSGQILSYTDPAASVGTLNTRRTITTAPLVALDPTEALSVEIQSPQNGTGSGRTMKYYRAVLRFATAIPDGSGGYIIAGSALS